MGIITTAVGIVGALWGAHALGIISLTPELLPSGIAVRPRNISRQADRIGTPRRLDNPNLAQDVFNTLFGAFTQREQKMGRPNELQQRIGSAGAGVAGPPSQGGL